MGSVKRRDVVGEIWDEHFREGGATGAREVQQFEREPSADDTFDCVKPGGKHRRSAAARARQCATCSTVKDRAGERASDKCLGCGGACDYYSCSPGYCALCAHDPCWQRIT